MSKRPIIITGLSGAGISTVSDAMEDFKFEVISNVPLSVIPQLCAEERPKKAKGLALAVDARTRGFTPEALLALVEAIDARLVFITCDDTILHKRFAETRRRHPLAQNKPASDGIKKERSLLEPLKARADLLIDSSDTSIHDLRHILEGHFVMQAQDNLTVSFMSFGFKNGIPRSADIVMDVRFLKNPHWNATLKPKTGLDKEVGAYVKQDPDFETFLENLKALILPLVPRYAAEGKSYLTIAIGCTGGRHRSVFVVETLKCWLEKENIMAFAEHRDLKK